MVITRVLHLVELIIKYTQIYFCGRLLYIYHNPMLLSKLIEPNSNKIKWWSLTKTNNKGKFWDAVTLPSRQYIEHVVKKLNLLNRLNIGHIKLLPYIAFIKNGIETPYFTLSKGDGKAKKFFLLLFSSFLKERYNECAVIINQKKTNKGKGK